MKLAAILITIFMIMDPTSTGKATHIPAAAGLAHCEGREAAIASATQVKVNQSPATPKVYPPKSIAVLILVFFFLNGLYILIAGRFYPSPGASAVRRDEQPGRYWRNILGYLVVYIIGAVVLCKHVHLL